MMRLTTIFVCTHVQSVEQCSHLQTKTYSHYQMQWLKAKWVSGSRGSSYETQFSLSCTCERKLTWVACTSLNCFFFPTLCFSLYSSFSSFFFLFSKIQLSLQLVSCCYFCLKYFFCFLMFCLLLSCINLQQIVDGLRLSLFFIFLFNALQLSLQLQGVRNTLRFFNTDQDKIYSREVLWLRNNIQVF